MTHEEEETIKAINDLKANYPYAAAMLCYVVIERQLKEYILKHRNDEDREVTLFNGKKVKLKDYVNKSNQEFIGEVLTKLTLSQTEKSLDISTSEGAAKDRDDLMHSNLYILAEKQLSDAERHDKNKEHFERAKPHLIRTFRNFSDIQLAEEEGILVFRAL